MDGRPVHINRFIPKPERQLKAGFEYLARPLQITNPAANAQSADPPAANPDPSPQCPVSSPHQDHGTPPQGFAHAVLSGANTNQPDEEDEVIPDLTGQDNDETVLHRTARQVRQEAKIGEAVALCCIHSFSLLKPLF